MSLKWYNHNSIISIGSITSTGYTIIFVWQLINDMNIVLLTGKLWLQIRFGKYSKSWESTSLHRLRRRCRHRHLPLAKFLIFRIIFINNQERTRYMVSFQLLFLESKMCLRNESWRRRRGREEINANIFVLRIIKMYVCVNGRRSERSCRGGCFYDIQTVVAGRSLFSFVWLTGWLGRRKLNRQQPNEINMLKL